MSPAPCSEIDLFPSAEPIELLLPGATGECRALARRVTTFMRLLVRDAGSVSAALLVVDAERATRELAQHADERARQALESLLAHLLREVAGADSCAWFAAADPGGLSAEEAWRVLGQGGASPSAARRARSAPPVSPRPGESALACAARLLEGAPARGLAPWRVALWQARVLWLEQGPGAGAAALLGCLEGARRARDLARVVECATDLAALELDRGAPAAALEVTRSIGKPCWPGAQAARLATLERWARIVLVREAPFHEHPKPPAAGAAGVAQVPGDLPAPLAELRAAAPGWLPGLPGRPARETLASAGAAPAHLARLGEGDPVRLARELGASVVVLFVGRGKGFSAVEAHVAPGRAARLSIWLDALADCWRAASHPAQALILRNEPVIVRATVAPGARAGETSGARAGAQADALAGAGPGRAGRLELPAGSQPFERDSLALALAPVEGNCGEAIGWMHLEFAHHLVPSRRCLGALGRVLARRAALAARPVLGPRFAASLFPCALPESIAPDSPGPHPVVPARGWSPVHDPRAAVFERCVAQLGAKTAHRRWWGFAVGGGRPVPVATGGGGLSSAPRGVAGSAQGLARSLATRGVFTFDDPDARLSVDAGACSGWVVPLCLAQRVVGLLAMESRRRADFRPADVGRAAAVASSAALDLAGACFAWRQRERSGEEVFFDGGSPGFSGFVTRAEALLRSRRAIVLHGERGTGKRTLASWLHDAESPDAAAPTLRAVDLEPGALAGWASVRESRLLLTGIEELDPRRQRELAGLLREGAARVGEGVRGGRWILTLRSAAPPGLARELVDELPTLGLRVPTLAERRAEIPRLARFLLGRLAAREGCVPPRPADAALALLWRQSWPAGLRDLRAVLRRWVLAHPGREIDAARAAATWSDGVPAPVARLVPRATPREDLAGALYVTRTAGGRVNRRRAALYLGWDPDTLATRMRSAALGPGCPVPRAW